MIGSGLDVSSMTGRSANGSWAGASLAGAGTLKELSTTAGAGGAGVVAAPLGTVPLVGPGAVPLGAAAGATACDVVVCEVVVVVAVRAAAGRTARRATAALPWAFAGRACPAPDADRCARDGAKCGKPQFGSSSCVSGLTRAWLLVTAPAIGAAYAPASPARPTAARTRIQRRLRAKSSVGPVGRDRGWGSKAVACGPAAGGPRDSAEPKQILLVGVFFSRLRVAPRLPRRMLRRKCRVAGIPFIRLDSRPRLGLTWSRGFSASV